MLAVLARPCDGVPQYGAACGTGGKATRTEVGHNVGVPGTSARPRTAAAEAERRVAEVRDDPDARLQLMVESYGAGNSWARAETAFMEWEIERGVLRPADADPPGSPWWRTINEHLLRDAEEARLLKDAGSRRKGSTPAVARWMSFFGSPSALTWYRAHNASVCSAYLHSAELAARETAFEQKLMNLTLMRVLYAQVMEEDHLPFGLGPLTHIGRFLADPRSMGIGGVMKVPDFYPRHYPLDDHETRCVAHRSRNPIAAFLAVIDDDLLLPRLEELYEFAARVLELPSLLICSAFGMLAYPWALLVAVDELGAMCERDRRPSFIRHEAHRLLHGRMQDEESIDLR